MIFDVAVVGAGPAGASAAIRLAREGLRVVAVDRATFPRDKCCGDGLTASAIKHLAALGLDFSAVASWHPVERAHLRSPAGHVVALDLRSRPLAAVARRVDLDAAVLAVAKRNGVDVRDGVGLVDARLSGDAVTLALADGSELDASFVVGADGIWSPLRKALATGRPRRYIGDSHAYRRYYRTWTDEARDLWVWFDEDLLPAFAWSFPLPDGRANVGFGVHHKYRSTAPRFDEVISRDHIRNVLGAAEPEGAATRSWPIASDARHDALTACGGRVLFVGDAARAADPLTGEGIGQAFETGALAAQAVIDDAKRGPSAVGARYEATATRALGPDQWMSRAVMRLLRHQPVARAGLRGAASTEWTRTHFARWMFEDYRRSPLHWLAP